MRSRARARGFALRTFVLGIVLAVTGGAVVPVFAATATAAPAVSDEGFGSPSGVLGEPKIWRGLSSVRREFSLRREAGFGMLG
jgi:hypothetical protein